MVSVKEHGVFVSGFQLAGIVKAGRFFLFVYIIYNRGRNRVISWKKDIHFLFLRSTETAFCGKGSLEAHGNRELVVGDGRRIDSKYLCKLHISKVSSLSSPVMVCVVINSVILVLGKGVTHIHESDTCLFKSSGSCVQIRILVSGSSQGRELI